jgi:hypothetical protein
MRDGSLGIECVAVLRAAAIVRDRGGMHVLSQKPKNHRQGIAGGFGGLASSRVKALLETKRQPEQFVGNLTRIIANQVN